MHLTILIDFTARKEKNTLLLSHQISPFTHPPNTNQHKSYSNKSLVHFETIVLLTTMKRQSHIDVHLN